MEDIPPTKQQLKQDKSSKKQLEAEIKQPQKEQNKLDNNKQQIRKELQSMQFQPYLIQQALTSTNNLQEAMQFIISMLEDQDQIKTKNTQIIQLVVFVRMDLNMSNGKIAAQCAHVTLRAFQNGRARTTTYPQYAPTLIQWLETGRKITYFRVSDQQQLFKILQECKVKGAPTTYIRDAGRTQVAAGSVTVGSAGPLDAAMISQITKKLIKY